jgi:hypothetical protein
VCVLGIFKKHRDLLLFFHLSFFSPHRPLKLFCLSVDMSACRRNMDFFGSLLGHGHSRNTLLKICVSWDLHHRVKCSQPQLDLNYYLTNVLIFSWLLPWTLLRYFEGILSESSYTTLSQALSAFISSHYLSELCLISPLFMPYLDKFVLYFLDYFQKVYNPYRTQRILYVLKQYI